MSKSRENKDFFFNSLEKPGTIKDIDGFALFIDSSLHKTTFVLYDPSYYGTLLKNEIANAKSEYNKIPMKDGAKFDKFYSFSNVQDVMLDHNKIYGYLVLTEGRELGLKNSCLKANEVRSLCAKNGYTTLMLLIAMIDNSPIMPKRQNNSYKMSHFWKYLYSLKSKIETEKFSNETSLHKKEEGDCRILGKSYLDCSYSLKRDYNLKGLEKNHEAFLDQMEEYFDKHGVDFVKKRIKEYISAAGNYFLESQQS